MAGVYVHIPFCASRCSYCDFFSTLEMKAVGTPYVEALIGEARLRRHELGDDAVRTLYLGGGTPSQLPLPLITRLVEGLNDVIGLSEVEEFTVEANPDDVTPAWCDSLVPLGVNRVSMGVQTFQDDILRAIGRRHTARQVVQAVENLNKAGIDNISIDLIYGLPGQTLDSWARTVDAALALKPRHVSAYWLTYEPGTRLWQQRERGEVTEVSDEDCATMYHLLVRRLQEAGFEHYEISNFGLPGYHSRHNSSYWDGTPYLGLGAAAHSYDGNVRRSNPSDLHAYIDRIGAGELACEEEQMTLWERYDERVMLALRTSAGVDVEQLRVEFGSELAEHFLSEVRRHLAAGNVRREGESRYVLTADGVLLSDSVMRDVMWDG